MKIMKSNKNLCFILCFFCFSVYAETELTFAMDDRVVFPWSLPATEEGLDIVLLKLVDDKLPEVRFKYISMPWDRCFLELRKNKIDGVFQASFKEKRKRFGVYPESNGSVDILRSLHVDSYSLFINKGSLVSYDGNKITGLNRKVISTTKGYSIFDDLKIKGYPVYGHSEPTMKQFKLLLKDKFSAVASLTFDGDELLLNEDFMDKIVKLKPPLAKKYYYLMLSKQFVKKQPELAQKIWNEIQKTKTSKKYQQAIREWLKKPREFNAR
jgi:polar amino acid transport system substrate-binding protein